MDFFGLIVTRSDLHQARDGSGSFVPIAEWSSSEIVRRTSLSVFLLYAPGTGGVDGH